MPIAQEVLRERPRILEAARRHGASKVRIFGSGSGGELGADSDLDLLVEMETGRSLLDLIALSQELEDLLHRPVDVVTEKALSPHLRDRILRQAAPL